MECSHISNDIVRLEVIRASLPPSDVAADALRCKAGGCGSTESTYICLTCGNIGCGRYINHHALDHYDATKHPLAIDVRNAVPFCYECDDYIIAPTEGLSDVLDNARNLVLTSLHPNGSAAPTDEEMSEERQSDIAETPNSVALMQELTPEENESKRASGEVASDSNLRPKQSRRRKMAKHFANTRKSMGVIGLRNLGNTCFMNAILQSLSNTIPLRDYFLVQFSPNIPQGANPQTSGPRTRKTKSLGEFSICSEFCYLLREIWSGESTVISPNSFFTTLCRAMPIFRGYQQQDAQEFLRYLLDRMHTELCSKVNNDNTIVMKLFRGILWNKVMCLHCGSKSDKEDPFLDLSLDIPERFAARRNKVLQRVDPCTVYDCLKAFTDVEELADTERYMCTKCQAKRRCTKKFTLKKLPEVLCLHIKRFRWTRHSRSKIDTYVRFPLEGLDVGAFAVEDRRTNIYDLYAAVVHHGSGPGSGHYTAYVLGVDSQWYHISDGRVTMVSPERLAEDVVYMLFYRRRKLKTPRSFTNMTTPPSSTVSSEASSPVSLSAGSSSAAVGAASSSNLLALSMNYTQDEEEGYEGGDQAGTGSAGPQRGRRRRKGQVER
ncbi:uncharacterized protein VTP21DRAFT_9919 [Calcarisporiella thermophila]|uniref:uncharacterized protein n=1 Tax=Calcarisporiella thermophila TaxID=911321 RepID=UPI003743CD37